MSEYQEMIERAMKSQHDAEEWFSYIRKVQARQRYERELIKNVRKKHPGLTNSEILKRYSDYES